MNIHESFDIGPVWVAISDWDDEHVHITGDIGEWRLIDETLPHETTLEEAKRITADKMEALLAAWSADLEKFRGLVGDGGTEAFVVVLKRTDGSTPKLCKAIGEKFHLVREEADAALAALPAEIRASFEIRPVVVNFVSAGEE